LIHYTAALVKVTISTNFGLESTCSSDTSLNLYFCYDLLDSTNLRPWIHITHQKLDVQLTKDQKIVVWHGPKLDKVKIEGQRPSKFKRSIKRKRKIWHYNFDEELKDRSWVADLTKEREKIIANIPEKPERQLILLEKFLIFLKWNYNRQIPLNIELKGQKIWLIGRNLFLKRRGEDYPLKEFKKILDQEGNGRAIIVASTSGKVLQKFDEINKGSTPYFTNMSICEQSRYSKYMVKWYISLFYYVFFVRPLALV
jgi:hypothetical protein